MFSFANASIAYPSAALVWLKVTLLSFVPMLPFEINEIPHPSIFALFGSVEALIILYRLPLFFAVFGPP